MKLFKVVPLTQEVALAGIPPTPSINNIPSWYKKIPPFSNNDKKLRYPFSYGTHNTTLKRCVPFRDAMTAGYLVLLHDDIYVEQKEDGPFIRWKSGVEILTWHTIEQFDGLPIPDNYHNMVAKWQNDYAFNIPSGYSLWCTHPVNRFDLPFLTLTGFVDADSFSVGIQFPFFLQLGFEGIIPSGTPVAQLIPIKRDSWKLQVEPFNKDNVYSRFRRVQRTFVDSYKKNFWHRKSYS